MNSKDSTESLPIDENIYDDDENEDNLKKIADVNLYAILNINSDASEEDLKNAYKRSVLLFHPDKHKDSNKINAESKFQKIQYAYDILSDSGKRYIYDLYGHEGISTSWEIGTKFKTKEELREEFERKKRIEKRDEMNNLIKSKGHVNLRVNASSLFAPYDFSEVKFVNNIGYIRKASTLKEENYFLDIYHRLKNVTFKTVTVGHFWEAKLNDKTDLTIGGSAGSGNVSASRSFSTSLRHVHSPLLWGEVSTSVGSDSSVSVKVVRNFSEDSFATVSAATNTTTIPPVLNFTIGRRLSKTFTGYIRYSTGEFSFLGWGNEYVEGSNSSTAIGIVRTIENGATVSANLQAGIISSSVTTSISRNFEELLFFGKNIRLKADFYISTNKANISALGIGVGADKRVGNYGKIGFSVDTSILGITLRLRFIRQGQKLSLPIFLTQDLDLKVALYALIFPIGSLITLDHWILRPARLKRRQEEIKNLKVKNAEELAKRKQEALEAIELMRDSAQRKVEQESSKNGLIIVSAQYGLLSEKSSSTQDLFSMNYIKTKFNHLFNNNISEAETSGLGKSTNSLLEEASKDSSSEFVQDVTIVLQSLVQQSQFHLMGGVSKSNLIGFYDPCFWEKNKKLRILYRFKGKLHEVEVNDLEK
ncbi:hypothetical protein HDU92_007653, partial [Lobulomyces angularis]